MKAIIAINNEGFIGLNGGLPWHCLEDLKHFKTLTEGSTLLVGYKTAQTLPDLKGRKIIVDDDNVKLKEIDWCVGGKRTYEKYAYLFDELHISHINDDTIGDTFAPDLAYIKASCKIYHYHF